MVPNSERPVSTIFPPNIIPNRAYERIKKISDTLPLISSDEGLEEENGKVTLFVTIDKELLRRLEASDHPDLATGGITRVEEGLHFMKNSQPGEFSHEMKQ